MAIFGGFQAITLVLVHGIKWFVQGVFMQAFFRHFFGGLTRPESSGRLSFFGKSSVFFLIILSFFHEISQFFSKFLSFPQNSPFFSQKIDNFSKYCQFLLSFFLLLALNPSERLSIFGCKPSVFLELSFYWSSVFLKTSKKKPGISLITTPLYSLQQ